MCPAKPDLGNHHGPQSTEHPHDHDGGFARDLPRLLGRRGMLRLMGGVGLASLSGLPAAALECVALPWETAGPYPADGTNSKAGQTVNALTQEGVLRRDIRSSFGAYSGTAKGERLELELVLVDAQGCTPLAGYAIYIWHCDADGKYSLYDFTDQNYLRGLAVADQAGSVTFTTNVAGCYDGRWPHIHFEVFESVQAAVSGEASVLTAQIALPHDVVAELYETDALYETSTRNLDRISLATDNVFADNTEVEIAQQTLAMSGTPETGYAARLTIPVDFDATRSAALARPPAGGPGAMGGRPFRGAMPPARPDE
ncbi:Dioxygenase [Aquimixticola soesokkakensis]|uniref:Dioxygenase n=1 Tax=Aquimixticola soesokkakensis TaxID=1519096 RepID=A0A1Y5SSL5_9RHOB|nr:hypothetical protein [Aquimixticola soesokkakensis]SLN45522.1 Dioxygenase [Aquimixticola soesokkakensis]